MRLLNTRTLVVEDFVDNIPSYAILSHTWAEEEVLLEEIGTPKAEEKVGFQKIKRCCAQAASDGHDYVWIDTCCIDKRSSAELSEAINSMFRWYQNAKICYAHLADLEDGKEMTELKNCRWFTRGWTLQELLAPSQIIFLAGDRWTNIGTKASLGKIISRITGIDLCIIEDSANLVWASVAQKMSWAAHRNTTRVEDTAYCLLGIFNVNMPLLYGEGGNAFIRLQIQLLNISNEHTIFAWSLDQPSWLPMGLLAPGPVAFSNCGDVVEHVYNATPPHLNTNIGLSITLPLVRVRNGPPDAYLAYLDCYSKRSGRVCLKIFRGSAHSLRWPKLGLLDRERKWAQRTAMVCELTINYQSDQNLRLPSYINSNRPLETNAVSMSNETALPQCLDETSTLLPPSPQGRTYSRFYSWYMRMCTISWLTLARTYIHVLLVFVPLGIIAGILQWRPQLVFSLNLVAIIPLASLLGFASEKVPARLGPKWDGLLEETLGNLVELILCITALVNGNTRLVQNLILGTILAKLLFVVGVCALTGAIRYGEQTIHSKAASTMCSIAAAAVSFVVIPALLHASIDTSLIQSHHSMVTVSRGISIPLIVLYILYMAFRLQPRADFLDERVYVGEGMETEHSFGTIPAAITMTLVVLVMLAPAWYLIDSIGCAASLTLVPESFFGIILLPMVASSAELAPALFFTYEDTMNLAINVVVGSAMQIALLIMPFLVILGWLIGQRMTLHFQSFESIVLFLTVFVVVLHIQDGRSTYVASTICLATYTVIALAFYLHPDDYPWVPDPDKTC